MATVRVVRDVRAPADVLWDLVADVERWPERLPTVDRLEVLGHEELGPGSQARIEQPKLRPMTWTVTRFDPGWELVWEASSGGVRVVGGHRVEPLGTGSRLVLTLAQSGLLAPLATLLLGRTTRRYVETEGDTFQRLAEAAAR